MADDDHKAQNASVEGTDGLESSARRDVLRRLAKGGAVVPIAAVVYNASTTVAAAS